MKKIILLFVVFFTASALAQQDAQFTQYMYNMTAINPAYAGSSGSLNLNFLGRAQWIGVDGAPRTFSIGMNTPVGNNVGLGLSVIVDEVGPVKEQNIYGDFSYTLTLGRSSKLAFGIKAGLTLFNLCLPCLETTNPDDVAFISNNLNDVAPNIGAGLYYYTDAFYAGVSVPNLLKTVHFKTAGGQLSSATDVNHFFLTSGYVFNVSKNVKLKPSTFVKAAPGSPLSIDLSGNVLFHDRLELGVSYRLDNSVSGMINFRTSRSLRIGYAYDHTVSDLATFNTGSHEIFILFNFDFDRNRTRSPRFF